MPHRWDPISPPVPPLVVPVRIDPTGRDGPTAKQSRGPRWRRTSPGLFVPATVDGATVEQRIVESHARAGPRAVLTGWASLRLQRANFFDGLARDGRTPLPVPIAANGERLASDEHTAVVRDVIPDDEVVVLNGMRCTRPERALYDEMQRIGELREMAVAVGSACAARLTSVGRMRLYAATRRWYRDVRLVKEAIEMAHEDCRSPQEHRFALIWEHDAKWSRPLVNRPVYDVDGRFIATPDLLDPERGVVGEYAGAGHRDLDQHAADIAREADLRDVGLEYVEVVGRDLRDPWRVVRRMQHAAARAVHLERRWVVGPAAWPLTPVE
ncbi:hypothetical protein GON03_11970 [Nocardioides sp. MAH-18]|uniref:AbiEi antitoxin C-terminal domain-containing protein n=1 Tax=Nocardioides agri TaxID=2682843 RepID=A0A6L6XT18_9ACTN|nr:MULTISPECIES: hypothetical protein [unclassified Nocardioides]MBA2955049.1 hypothetical protein [Nocardioides sp. CGMCC 1.13656]MVQ49903.1 hypothetical protein [Nocardioides sp. MAH-18]